MLRGKKMNKEYFEIRLESIGGLGANLCGKLLGELAVEALSLNASSFSSYGSEKTGSPVSAYIRWCPVDRPIYEVTPIRKPDIIGIFHEAMLGGKNMFSGASNKTRVVINSARTPDEIRREMDLRMERVYAVDCEEIARKEGSRVNMVMFGAIISAMEIIDSGIVIQFLEKEFQRGSRSVLEGNKRAFLEGYNQVKCDVLDNVEEFQIDKNLLNKSQWGYENAPIGGMNPIMGSTITNDLSAVRHKRVPRYLPEKCIHCGLCDTTCPDMVFRFEPGEYNKKLQMVNCGLDYHHCKGCLRCVEICPTHALVEADESKDKLRFFVRNKDLIVDHLDYEAKGANSWMTSESLWNDGGLEGGNYEP